MGKNDRRVCFVVVLVLLAWGVATRAGEQTGGLRKACIDGDGPGWRALTLDDFVNVNCADDTWSMKDGMICCTGTPVGVTRTTEPLENFELVVEWRHLKSGGNSGVFVWVPLESLENCILRIAIRTRLELAMLLLHRVTPDVSCREHLPSANGCQHDDPHAYRHCSHGKPRRQRD